MKVAILAYFGGYAIVLYVPYPYCLIGFTLMTIGVFLVAREAFKLEDNPKKCREVFM